VRRDCGRGSDLDSSENENESLSRRRIKTFLANWSCLIPVSSQFFEHSEAEYRFVHSVMQHVEPDHAGVETPIIDIGARCDPARHTPRRCQLRLPDQEIPHRTENREHDSGSDQRSL
jgi:hypothetical protein